MSARAPQARRAIPLPPAPLLPALGAAAALDGMTGLVVLSAGNSYLLRTLGAVAVLPALALTLHALTKVTTSPIAGRLADRRRLVAVVPAVPVLATLGLTTMLLTHNIAGYLIGLAALTAGTSTAWVLLRHCIGHATSHTDRGSATTWLSLAAGGASALGFAAGTVLAGIAPRAAFGLGLILAAAAAFLLNVTRRLADRPTPDAGGHLDVQRAPAIGRRGSVTLGLVAAGQFALSAGLLVAFWPYVLRDLDLQAVRVAALLVPAGTVTLLVLIAVARWSRAERRLSEVATLYATIAGGLVIAASVHGPVGFAIAMTAVIPALAGAVPVVTAAVIDFSRGRSGPAGALGWLGSAEAAGSLAGSGLTGIVIASVGARSALGVLAGLAVGLALVTGVSIRVSQTRTVSQPAP